MRLRQAGAVALFLSVVLSTASAAVAPRPIEPTDATLFRPIVVLSAPTQAPTAATIYDYHGKPTPSIPQRPSVPDAQPGVIDIPQPSVSGTSSGTYGVVEGSRIARAYAQSRLSNEQYQCLNKLWTKESGWRWNAENSSSGAYGIPQALPGSKMAKAGDDWRTNPITQVKWGLGYVSGRYGSACAAWSHSQLHGWY